MLIRRDVIKRLRVELEKGNLFGVASRKAGVKSTETIYGWRKKINKDRLTKLIQAAQYRGQQNRDDMVEDAQFKRLVEGRASGSEYEFYLTNRRTDRWKKLNEFGNTAGAPVLIKPPVINYISVSVNNGKTEVVQQVENENGNGRLLDHV